jgi:hypothetical protein
LIAVRKRFGSDPSGRGNAWIFEYDASSPEALAQIALRPPTGAEALVEV